MKLAKLTSISLAMLLGVSAFSTPWIAHASTNQVNQQYAQDEVMSEAELAQALAPIALYPDTLLTHILIASTYPLELVQAYRWSQKHEDKSSQERMSLAEKQPWDPSVIALTAFPTVLEKLNNDLTWTQDLGDAFLQDEEGVLAMIQTLRQQADDANSLDDMENMKVTKVEKQIIIEPAKPEVIYVPYYDTRVVYGHWRWHAYPPVYWYTRPVYAYHRPIFWGPSIHIHFNYFFGSVHWSHRRVVVINHRHTHYYKPARKIAYSHGAQRWHHKPAHRHGVAYKNKAVSKRFDKPYRYEHHQVSREYKTDKKLHANKAQSKPSKYQAHIQQHDRVNRALKNEHSYNRDKTNISQSKVHRDLQKSATKPVTVTKDRTYIREKDRDVAKNQKPSHSSYSDRETREISKNRVENVQPKRQDYQKPTRNINQDNRHREVKVASREPQRSYQAPTNRQSQNMNRSSSRDSRTPERAQHNARVKPRDL